MAYSLVGMFIILIQVFKNISLPERDTQEIDTGITSLMLLSVMPSVLCCNVLVTDVVPQVIATAQVISIVLWIPRDDLLSAILSFCELFCAISSIAIYFMCDGVINLVTYVLWLSSWMVFIYHIGRIIDEFRSLKRKPHRWTLLKKGKKHRRKRFTCYNKNAHRAKYFQALRQQELQRRMEYRNLHDWNFGWCDDDDPFQGNRNPRIWTVLHTSILPQLWDEVCKINPEIGSIILGG